MARERFEQMRAALIAGVLGEKGTASRELRAAAFANAGLREPLQAFVAKIVNDSTAIQNADIRDIEESGMTEDQIFELVICSAAGEATRQYESALQVLESLRD